MNEHAFCPVCSRILGAGLEEWDDSPELLCFGGDDCIPLHENPKMKTIALQGWEVGWIDELGAAAAVTDRPKIHGRRRLLVMTQDDHAPTTMSEPVDLALYELGDDDSWEMLVHDDFGSIPEALEAIRVNAGLWS